MGPERAISSAAPAFYAAMSTTAGCRLRVFYSGSGVSYWRNGAYFLPVFLSMTYAKRHMDTISLACGETRRNCLQKPKALYWHSRKTRTPMELIRISIGVCTLISWRVRTREQAIIRYAITMEKSILRTPKRLLLCWGISGVLSSRRASSRKLDGASTSGLNCQRPEIFLPSRSPAPHTHSPSKSLGTSTCSGPRSVAFCAPQRAMEVSSSAWMISSAFVTPACPIAPSPCR